MRCPARFIAASALAAVSLVPLSVASRAAGAQTSLPSALVSFLSEEAHATPSEREALLAGNPLIKLLDADPSQEIAVLGAVWVNAAPRLYVEQVKNIEQFEGSGAFRITKRIGDPPSRSDGLSGFTGRVIRGRVRSEVEDGTRAALIATKTRLESKGMRP